MNRSLFILLGALALGAAIFAGSYFASQRTCMMCETRTTDDLGWMRSEFQLSDLELARIRQLHEDYLPKCAEMCAKIAAKQRELESALANATNLTAEAQTKLSELAGLRAQCQAQMLQHLLDVSRTMPLAAGQRYFAEMQRVTLGLPEPTEQAMSGTDPGHEQQP